MTDQPTSLAEGFATLRRTAETAAPHGWMPAPIHALLVAILVRLVGRLETMVAQWQQGLLPPPPAPRAPAPCEPTTSPRTPPFPAPAAKRPTWAERLRAFFTSSPPPSAPVPSAPRSRLHPAPFLSVLPSAEPEAAQAASPPHTRSPSAIRRAPTRATTKRALARHPGAPRPWPRALPRALRPSQCPRHTQARPARAPPRQDAA